MTKALPYSQFLRAIEFLGKRRDDTGYVRIWGVINDAANTQITFWRHKRGNHNRFNLMHGGTYVGDRTVAEKIAEKLDRGYAETDLSEKHLRQLHYDYLQAKAKGLLG